MTSSHPSWSIAVRTVGGKHVGQDERDDFTVIVSPDDDLACLHHKIEDVTGLKASQQRLIYRGRIITNGRKNDESDKSEPKVRDVVGLCDGQTIHLVPKPEEEETTNTEEQNPSDEGGSSSSAEGGTTSLLAALLGLGSLEEEEESGPSSIRRLRSTRMGRRRPNHRLTESDNIVPDPGPMEPLRQGLMTLHTMLDAERTEHPWEAHRQWYRGQWLDCRDTVNQWLEATILDIARPEDIFSGPSLPKTHRRQIRPATDPPVSANDHEGRRRLLLEPDCEDVCQRPNNDGVQLLLIHYNGWPHRWDEWIRSDSERIRPFRTRTRHSSTMGALPTPQSVFDGAPATNIKEESDEGERAALLPELSRAVSSVHDVLEQVVCNVPEQRLHTSRPNNDLPWFTDSDDFPSALSENGTAESEASVPRYSRRQLETLAPLLDRLGRALTDAAPHVAYFAGTLPQDEGQSSGSMLDPEADNVVIVGETDEEPVSIDERSPIASTSGGGLFSLLSRDSRARNNASVTRSSGSSFYTANADDLGLREEAESSEADHVDFVNGMVNTTRGDPRSGGRRGGLDDSVSGLLGAYLALSSLASDGPSDNNDNEGGGLQALGRLLRDRGNNGGGIDIHIHAIVTGPGIMPGAIPMAIMGEPPVETNTGGLPRGLFSGVGRRVSGEGVRATAVIHNTDEDDDMGIFADLYSENPAPLDPHGNPIRDTHGNPISDTNTTPTHDGAEGGGPTLNSHAAYSRTRPGLERRSPSRLGSFASQRNGRNGHSPRRGSTVGRSLRNLLSPRRRSHRPSGHDSDSEQS